MNFATLLCPDIKRVEHTKYLREHTNRLNIILGISNQLTKFITSKIIPTLNSYWIELKEWCITLWYRCNHCTILLPGVSFIRIKRKQQSRRPMRFLHKFFAKSYTDIPTYYYVGTQNFLISESIRKCVLTLYRNGASYSCLKAYFSYLIILSWNQCTASLTM